MSICAKLLKYYKVTNQVLYYVGHVGVVDIMTQVAFYSEDHIPKWNLWYAVNNT